MLSRAKLLLYKAKLYLTFTGTNDATIEVCGRTLLNRGQLASDIYDIMVTAPVLREQVQDEGPKYLVQLCQHFTSTHSEADLIRFLRKEFFSSEYSSMEHNALLLLGLYLNDYYSDELFSGMLGDTVYHVGLPKPHATAFDCYLSLAAALELPKVSEQNKRLLSTKVQEKVKQHYSSLISYFLAWSQVIAKEEKLSTFDAYARIVQHLYTAIPSIYATALCTPLKSGSEKYLTLATAICEDVINVNSWYLKLTHHCIGLVPPAFLQDRDFYIREKGVIVRLMEPIDGFDKLYMREVHEDGFHYIFVRAIFQNTTDAPISAYRDYVWNIDNFPTFTVTLLYELDGTVMLIVLAVLGLLPSFLSILDGYQHTCNDPALASAVRTYREAIGPFTLKLLQSPWTFEEPVWWNYELKNTDSAGHPVHGRPIKRVHVGRYTRALPAGQKPSAKAVATAAQYHMNLKPGYTFVEEFEYITGKNKALPTSEFK